MNSGQKNKRQRAQRHGIWSEWIAATYLTCKGYRIVMMRYRTKVGEIDLIARKGDLAIMVEVKARSTVKQAVDAVTASTKRRIENASDLWLAKQSNASELSIRYDIVAICPWKWPVHFKDAI